MGKKWKKKNCHGTEIRPPKNPKGIEVKLKPGDTVTIYRRIAEPGEKVVEAGMQYTYIKKYPHFHLSRDANGFYESFGTVELMQRMRKAAE